MANFSGEKPPSKITAGGAVCSNLLIPLRRTARAEPGVPFFFSISLHSIYLWEIYGLWYGLLYMFIKLFLGYWWSIFREIRLSKSDESMGVWRQILTQDAISTPHECHVGDLPHAWLVTSRILLGKKRQLLGWWFFSWFGNKNNCIYI